MATNNIITIKGGAFTDVKKAFKRWLEMYTEDLSYDFVFELFKNGKGNHIITTDERLENYLFFTLVNYLKYPIDIDYKIEVEGFTIANDTDFFPKETLGKELFVYIPTTDTDYDYVLAQTENNEVFKLNLGRKVVKITDDKVFKLLEIDFSQLQDPEIVKLTYKPEKTKKETRQERLIASIGKRFTIFLYSILVIFAISILSMGYSGRLPVIIYFLGMFISGWFFTDYKMLQIDKYYYYCLSISGVLFLYGVFLKELFNFDNQVVTIAGITFFPIVFLIVQRPTRLIFKRRFGREPVLDRPIPSMEDGLYFLSLLVAFFLLAMGFAFIFKEIINFD